MKNSVDYTLIESVASIEDFLKQNFNCSQAKLKKYFDKSFLNKSLKAHATLNLPLNFVNDGEINSDYQGPPIKILYEDEYFFVMDKPFNLFVHPLVYDEKNNCLSFMRKYYPHYLKVNLENYDRGLLYRLDFETSGVLVYVKNDELYKTLRHDFNLIAKEKSYLCLVEGRCCLNGTYKHYFSSKGARGERVIVSDTSVSDQVGELEVRFLKYDSDLNVSLLSVQLKTGLRHQIRAQLSYLGFPIIGDQFYGGRMAQRLYLHAHRYQITLNQKELTFVAEAQNFSGL